MKKLKVTFGIAAAILAVGAITAGSVFAANATAEKNSIGSEAAAQIALADAGITQENTKDLRSVFDREDGQYIFDVEFTANNTRYEYHIDASLGTIVSRDTDGMDNIPTVDGTASVTLKTLDEAKAIALSDADLSADAVTFTKTELDRDDGRQHYEIDFYTDDKEYDYEIDAETGKIVENEVENRRQQNASQAGTASTTAPPTNNTSTPTTSTVTAPTGIITLEEAKAAALKDAGVDAADATFTKTKLEDDDGRDEYDIEFYTDDKKYEYEISAYTGNVTDKDIDVKKNQNNTSNVVSTPDTTVSKAHETAVSSNAEYIGTEKARDIALKHAGVSESEVYFSKTKLDRDDGRYEYEIEFYKDRIEYEYSIDAVTGDILEYDSEYDD